MTEKEEGGTSDFRGLFRGSANLGLLLGALSLKWTKSATFVSQFSPELNQLQDLSVGTDDSSVLLGTRGDGQDYVHRAARFMDESGVEEDDLKRFLVRAAFTQYENIFFSKSIRADDLIRFEYVLRRRQPLEVATAILVDAELGMEALALFRDASRILEKDTIHGITVTLGTQGEGVHIPVFSQPRETESWQRLCRLVREFELGESWMHFEENEMLRNSVAFVGPAFSSETHAPGLVVVFRDLPETVAPSLALDTEAMTRVESLLRICGRKSFNRTQLALWPSGRWSLRFICS